MAARLGRDGSVPMDALARNTWVEQLSRDLHGMGLWKAWYLAMDREKWRENATSVCCSGPHKVSDDLHMIPHAGGRVSVEVDLWRSPQFHAPMQFDCMRIMVQPLPSTFIRA